MRGALIEEGRRPGWGAGNASPACEVERRAPLTHELELRAAGHGQAACTAALGEVTLEILSVLRAQTGHTWSHPGLLRPGSKGHTPARRGSLWPRIVHTMGTPPSRCDDGHQAGTNLIR